MALGTPDLTIGGREYSSLPEPGKYIRTNGAVGTKEIITFSSSLDKIGDQSLVVRTDLYDVEDSETGIQPHVACWQVIRGELEEFADTELRSLVQSVRSAFELAEDPGVNTMLQMRRGEL